MCRVKRTTHTAITYNPNSSGGVLVIEALAWVSLQEVLYRFPSFVTHKLDAWIALVQQLLIALPHSVGE